MQAFDKIIDSRDGVMGWDKPTIKLAKAQAKEVSPMSLLKPLFPLICLLSNRFFFTEF